MSGQSGMSTYLSKSLFIRGLQCHKSLYLHKRSPELRDEITGSQESLFQAGASVGELAKKLFPGGGDIPYEGLTYQEQIDRTRAEIDRGAVTIYEAAFCHDEVFVKVDILHKGPGGWEIHEVKSSTSVKDVHLDDTAIQHYVVTGSGLTVSRASLVHINNQYVRQGDIDVKQLFTFNDITAEVKGRQPFVAENLPKLRDVICSGMPDINIGKHCDSPYACDFHGHCWRHIPEDSVFDLKGRGIDKFAFYRRGIVRMNDLPLNALNRSQRMQVESLLNKQGIIDRQAIRAFLDSLWYPLCFLDFETVYTAIPLFDGTRPYQQVPFQYSLHRQETAASELSHTEFLGLPGHDPRGDIVAGLLRDIPETACVVTYTGFETVRLSDLAAWFPEHKPKIDRLLCNVRDLSIPFRQMDYYHWEMTGSYSIKAVLPHLVPGMGYDSLEIQDGTMAMSAYFRMRESEDADEIAQIRKALLEYCGIDTLAMVRILERLRELSL